MGDFNNFLILKLSGFNKPGIKLNLVLSWVVNGHVKNRNTKEICKAYKSVSHIMKIIQPRESTAVLMSEAAIWEKDQVFSDFILKEGSGNLSSSNREKLHNLYKWRYSKNKKEALGLIEGFTPGNSRLPFITYYAKAQLADAFGKDEIAYQNYVFALKYLPQDSEEYRASRARCNSYLNEDRNLA